MCGFSETRPLVVVGVISFSILLWHEPLIRWLEGHGLTLAGRGGFPVNLVLAAAATAVASDAYIPAAQVEAAP